MSEIDTETCGKFWGYLFDPQNPWFLQQHHFFYLFFYVSGFPGTRPIGLQMTDFLSAAYPWTLAFHIVSVISWMAGLFYLPRLFVHHVEQAGDSEALKAVFEMMEYKLLRVIMNPAMIATWVFGLSLVFTPGLVDWSMVWPWTKGAGILGMTWYHHWLALRRKDLASGRNTVSGRRFRLMNEVPTVLMIVIVFSVVLKF